MAKPKVVAVVGTRPDAIKTAPVVRELRRYDEVETILVSTGQHREMLAQALAAFDLAPDHDLGIMQHGQTLADMSRRVLEGLDPLVERLRPDLVLAQGDTTTTFVASLAAFYRRVKFGHIEAGLRTESVAEPFPEEFNRRATALVAAQHYAPTPWAAENLIREGHLGHTVFVTGNTGIDAVRHVAEQTTLTCYAEWPGRVVVLTTHRRENLGEPQADIARAALEVARTHPDVMLVVPMHRNPAVRETLVKVLGGQPRVDLVEPPDYADFVKLMQRSALILTDSGGVQEEAPAFGVPVLVLRHTTERPEGVEAGAAKLVGTDPQTIVREAAVALSGARDPHPTSPYGDGKAALRIRYLALRELGVDSPEEGMWTGFRR
ncbi:MAG: UDP-N-acetylglucosamine 2-epimerase (non-hydrolyzing) [Fimbriimonadaceae bacterium]|nr:UDP-N-acetylglucosamine 2-epimerase (non-hydrolyzing) [Fimbriimonadaceae bacterium]